MVENRPDVAGSIMRAIVVLMRVAGCTGPVSAARRTEALTDIPKRLDR
jgi:hypothetical protein